LNLCCGCKDNFCGRGIYFETYELEPGMSKAVRLTASIPASKVTSRESDTNQLVSIALFCGVGLLVSLVAVLFGVQGVWY
jgi:hypothetical protein